MSTVQFQRWVLNAGTIFLSGSDENLREIKEDRLSSQPENQYTV